MISIPAGAELAHLRQALYQFFGRAMLPPDQRRLDDMAAAAELFGRSGIDAFAFAPLLWEVRAELGGPLVLDDVAATHIRLFETGTDGALCPPIESFYVVSARQGGSAQVLPGLERDFRRSGLEVAGQGGVTADHITPQLELMARLCEREADGREAGNLGVVAGSRDEQRRFLERHLRRWIPPFAARVAQLAPSGLYRATVAAIAGFVDHDRELLHVASGHEPAGVRT